MCSPLKELIFCMHNEGGCLTVVHTEFHAIRTKTKEYFVLQELCDKHFWDKKFYCGLNYFFSEKMLASTQPKTHNVLWEINLEVFIHLPYNLDIALGTLIPFELLKESVGCQKSGQEPTPHLLLWACRQQALNEFKKVQVEFKSSCTERERDKVYRVF